MTTPFSRLAIALAFAGTTGAGIGTLAAQQSPFKPPSNLKVLPKDAKLGSIIPMMKDFTQALGVRCQFCHSYTGTDPNALENFDFPGDSIPAKDTARKMISMLQAINGDLLKGIGEPPASGQSKVTCYTCHRGEKKPQTAAPPR
jgi:hypothetical protein